LSDRVEREIEAAMSARTGRDCVFVPSGRFGIYLAFRLLLSPGDRILMSPLEDDAVFFGALAAGLRPVMAPTSVEDGNMRLDAVDTSTWQGIGALMTGNTYGFPDRVLEGRARCDELGIPLIEDAAHALETDLDGEAVGSFGTLSVFSLSKHIRGRGGVVCFGDAVDRRDVVRLRSQLMLPTPAARKVTGSVRTAGRAALQAAHLRHLVERARRDLRPVRPSPWRISLREEELRHALSSNGVDFLDEWMNAGYPDFRMRQRTSALKRTLQYVRQLEDDRAQRIAGVVRLRKLDAVAPAVREDPPLPLLRVPLLVEDRDAVALELRRRRLNVYFVYAPPLDDYARELVDPSPDPDAARWWAAHVLPVDPREAERVLDLVARNEVRLTAAAPPTEAKVPEAAGG
jgi:hypothetical protein